MTDFRTRVNQQVVAYWKKIKSQLDYTPISKKRVPTFTRHNGHKLRRLSRSGWRHPKSCQGNLAIMTVPLIGYKGVQSQRGMLKAYGMAPSPINTIKQLHTAHQAGHLPVLARTLGARSRQAILHYAMSKNIPLLLRR